LLVVQVFNGGEQTWAASVPLYVSYFLLPILFGLAVLRYRLYDIEVIINRTVVLAVAAAFAGLGYTVLVVVVGDLVGRRTSGFWLSLLATALVALAFQPIRRWVVRFANRLAYGSRAQPYEALSDFSRRISETPSPETLLPAVADAAGRAVSARRATATLEVPGASAATAEWGQNGGDVGDTHVVPVRNGGLTLGSIEVTLPRGRPLHQADLRLLAALADQTAVAFRNTALETQLAAHVAELDRTTRQLADSRSRIIEADVAVRRNLEAAISREVLPHLVPLSEALRRARVAVAAGEGGDVIERLVASTNTALEALRGLTRGVFPTQLARAGIEPALRSFLARSGLASTLHVDPSAAERRFSARAEAAVYFGAAEVARSVPGLSSIGLAVIGEDLVLTISCGTQDAIDLEAIVDRVDAAGGSLSAADDVLELRIPVGTDESAYASLGSGSPGL
jgi:GAF domain-containing protein